MRFNYISVVVGIGLVMLAMAGDVRLSLADQIAQTGAAQPVDPAAKQLEYDEQKARDEEKEAAREAEKAKQQQQLKRDEAERAKRAGETLERRGQREQRLQELLGN